MFCNVLPETKDQVERATLLEEEWRRARDEAARLESERQSALLAKEELASLAESQQKSKEQLVSMLILQVDFRNTKDTLGILFASM